MLLLWQSKIKCFFYHFDILYTYRSRATEEDLVHAEIPIHSDFMTVWNWPIIHPKRVLLLHLQTFFPLRLSLLCSIPIWFKFCTHFLLVISSGYFFFLFLEFPNIKKNIGFFVAFFFDFGSFLLSDLVEILHTPSTCNTQGLFFSATLTQFGWNFARIF